MVIQIEKVALRPIYTYVTDTFEKVADENKKVSLRLLHFYLGKPSPVLNVHVTLDVLT